jgi:hypothetical protein
MRHNAGKPRWHLLPFDGIELAVRVLEFGARKYAPFNWEKGLSWSETADSMINHTRKWLRREETDEESGLSHVGHILCNALFLAAFVARGSGTDDRPPAVGKAPEAPLQAGDRVIVTGRSWGETDVVNAAGLLVDIRPESRGFTHYVRLDDQLGEDRDFQRLFKPESVRRA